MRPQGFPARLRLKQRRDFLRVQQGGQKHHVRHFLVFVAPRVDQPAPRVDQPATRVDEPPRADDDAKPKAPSAELPTRLGITVTRKIGNAVTRNRIKRLVREAFRRNRSRLPSGLDLVFVAKQQAAEVEYDQVLADFEALISRTLRRGARG